MTYRLKGGITLPIPNSDLSPIVTQDTITVTKTTPVSTDGYVMLALNTDITVAQRIIISGSQAQDPAFVQTNEGKLLIVPKYLYGNSNLKLKNKARTTEPVLRIAPNGSMTPGGSPSGRLVYNGGGSGAHKDYKNATGNTWTIWDEGADADKYPAVRWDATGSEITNTSTSFTIPDISGQNAISCRANGNGGLTSLYVDAVAANAVDSVIQETGSDITYKPYSPTAQINNPIQQLWLQIYQNTNPATPVYKRWEHNAGGGMLPFPITIQMLTSDQTDEQKLLGQIVVWSNVDAASDGVPVRDHNGFIADIAATSSVGLDPTFAPNSLTKTA